jgi:hypothetical protein
VLLQREAKAKSKENSMANESNNVGQQATTIIIKNNSSKLEGLASFVLGIISIFFMSPVFVPLAVILGIIAVFKKQLVWGILGLLCALVGFLTSPILLGALGLGILALQPQAVSKTKAPEQHTHTSAAPRSNFGDEPYHGNPPNLDEQLRQSICFIKRYAPKDYPGSVDFDCGTRVSAFDDAISAQLRLVRSDIEFLGCSKEPDQSKVKVVIAEVLVENRNSSLYQPGSAIPIATSSVCKQLTKKLTNGVSRN